VDTGLSHSRPRFVLGWGVIAERRVPSLPIVEHLDVFEDILFGFVSCGVVPMIDELTLEGSEKAFDTGVVPTVPLAAHAGGDAVLAELLLIARGRILATAVRVVQEPRHRNSVRQRHRQGPLSQIDGHAMAHRPTDHTTGVEIQ